MPFASDATVSARTDILAKLYALEGSRKADLDEARSIQRALLPVGPLQVGSVGVRHAFQPVQDVGGDFLDYYTLPDGTVGLYLGDVCGKGLPAAMYSALTVGILRGIHKTGQATSTVMSLLNRRMTLRGVTRRYSAMQYSVFDPVTGILEFTSAGMHGPFLVSGLGCRNLQESGLPPGLFADATYGSHSLRLAPGDSVVFCTDGIIEASNPEGEFFGSERLLELCVLLAENVPGTELAEHIFTAVESFSDGQRQHDDMAVVVLSYSGAEL